MSRSIRRPWTGAFAAVLALLGALLPASALLAALGHSETPADQALKLGALLFKLSLVVLGLAMFGVSAILAAARPQRHEARTVTGETRWVWGGVLILMAASAVLCLHGLDDGLWFDEIATYVRYARLPFGRIVSTYDGQNQHILYSLLAHAAFVPFGESAWALRLPAALFGVGSVWALFLVARLVTSRREALLASALMAFSYQLIWFSQNARGYTGLLFLTLLSSWLFLRALRDARPYLWPLYAVSVALGAYVHMTMLFVVAGHFIIYVLVCVAQPSAAWPQRWNVLLCGFGLAGVLTFQLYALVLPQVIAAFAHARVLGRPWTQPQWAVLEFARGLRVSLSGGGIALAALVLFAVGLLSFARSEPVAVQLLLLPVLICAGVKFAMGHYLWPRSFFFAFGFMAIVVIRGTMVVGRALGARLGMRSNAQEVLGMVLSVALILASARSIPFAYGPKQDFAGALAFVEAHRRRGDALVTVGLATFPYRTLYPAAEAQPVDSVEALGGVRAQARRTWLLYTLGFELADADPALMASIERDFVVEKQFPGTLGGGAVFVCRADRPTPGS